jgi:hypothetical protein
LSEVRVSVKAVHKNGYRKTSYSILQHYNTHSDVMLANRAYADTAFLLKMIHIISLTFGIRHAEYPL